MKCRRAGRRNSRHRVDPPRYRHAFPRGDNRRDAGRREAHESDVFAPREVTE